MDQIGVWYAAQTDDLQADLIAVMEILEAITRRDRWPESCFKELENRKGSQCKGLVELILEDDDGVQYRIFGFLARAMTTLRCFCRSGKMTIRHTSVHVKKLRKGKWR